MTKTHQRTNFLYHLPNTLQANKSYNSHENKRKTKKKPVTVFEFKGTKISNTEHKQKQRDILKKIYKNDRRYIKNHNLINYEFVA